MRHQVFRWQPGQCVLVVGHQQFEGESGTVVRREFVPDAGTDLPVVRLDSHQEHVFSDYELKPRPPSED